MMTVIADYEMKRGIECIEYPDLIFKMSLRKFDLSYTVIDKIVEEVDKSPRYIGNTFDSPVFGIIGADSLAGGTKALIMILNNYQPSIYSSGVFGPNVMKFLCDISFDRDFTIVVESDMEAYIDDDYNVCACTEDGRLLNTFGEVKMYGFEEVV